MLPAENRKQKVPAGDIVAGMAENSKKHEMMKLRLQNIGEAEFPYLFFKGEVSPPHLIFMHGTGFIPWLWQPVIEEISPRGDSWAPFICNYRKCDPEKGGLAWAVVAEDLARFCRVQKIREPLFVGHSMGATVSVMACSLFGLKPRGLILIEPIFLPEEFYNGSTVVQDHPLASKAIKRKNSWKDEQEAIVYLKSRALFDGWDEQMLRLYVEHGMQKQKEGHLALTFSPQDEAAVFMGGRKTSPWPLLGSLTCPALVVEASETENKKYVDVKKIVAGLRQGSYKSIAGAGHLVCMQKPKEIAGIIKKFNREIT